MTSVEPFLERLYSLEELTDLRRKTMRYARASHRETSAIVTGSSPSRFAAFSEVRNGCEFTPEKACCRRAVPVGTKPDPSD
jgi:hypothetical protein